MSASFVRPGREVEHSSASESHAVAEGSVLGSAAGATTEAASHVAAGSVKLSAWSLEGEGSGSRVWQKEVGVGAAAVEGNECE